MSPAMRPAHPTPLDRVRARCEHWRRTRHTRSPIPDALWALALAAAKAHGVYRTARTLRLHDTDLKRRLGAARGAPAQATFVELLPESHAAGPACTLELETARGTKLRIRLQGMAPPDLGALDPPDFRKGIDGLARVCRDALGADPFSGALFVFRNRRGTALKLLVYDSQGLWLCQKRLSTGRFRFWPTRTPGAATRWPRKPPPPGGA